MSIGNSLLNLMGQRDPRQDLLRAALGGGSTPAAGAGAPGTSAPQQPPQAAAYQSPQELLDLYGSLMDRESRAGSIDRGVNLIAASFAQPENRQLIMNSGSGGSAAAGTDPMESILNLHNAQVERQNAVAEAARKAQMASGLAGELGISENAAMVLLDGGSMDDLLLANNKPVDWEMVTDGTGQPIAWNPRDPSHVINVGGSTPINRDTQVVEAGGRQLLVYKDTGETVRDLGSAASITADQSDYDRYLADFQASEEQPNPMPFEQWKILAPAAGAPRTTINNSDGSPLTPMQQQIDTAAAPELFEFMNGGYTTARRNVTLLSEATRILQENPNSTGVVGLLRSMPMGEELSAFINPDGTMAIERVQEVVQQSLREILGAQFTQVEGEAMLRRAFNPNLPVEENIRRINMLAQQIGSMADSKLRMAEYALAPDEETGVIRGTLAGFQNQDLVGIDSFLSLMDEFGAREALAEEQSAQSAQTTENTPPASAITYRSNGEYRNGDVVENANQPGTYIRMNGGNWEWVTWNGSEWVKDRDFE